MSPRDPRFPLALLLLLAPLAACNDDDDDDGGPAPQEQDQFSAIMDRTQETPAPVTGTRVRVTVTNRAPELGTSQSPVWVAFHDGAFDVFDLGAAASAPVERVAEDGDFTQLEDDFTTSASGDVQDLLTGELGAEPDVIAPGETVSRVFELDPDAPNNAFFSYASHVLPSNDAFVGNDDPQAHPVFDGLGNLVATNFTVVGADALDAGTEQNDEQPASTDFFGQTVDDTGTAQGGTIAAHVGYLPGGSGGVLDDPDFTDADFTAVGYEFLDFRFEELGPVTTAALGVATVELVGNDVTFDIEATGLSGPAIDAHFHEGAPGVAGPIVLDIGSTIETDAEGNFRAQGTLPAPAGFADALRAGNIYVNVHTTLNPTGELRGQFEAQEAFRSQLTSAQETPTPVVGSDVRVTVTNRAPDLGTFQTAVWVGFHDGGFELLDVGSAADTFFLTSDALERLAEDGNAEPLRTEFAEQGLGRIDGLLPGRLGPNPEGGQIAPGETVSAVFRLDPAQLEDRFFSYATMVIPSNDAFSANDDPQAHPIFDVGSNFVATDFVVLGSEALDAGTEVNDEVPANTGFFGQTVPNTGTAEGGVVAVHPGFLAPGSGGILDDADFTAADFKAVGYELLQFRFEELTVKGSPTGMVVARLNEAQTELDFAVVAHGLSGPATDMHFHEGAPGVAGPPVIDVFDSIDLNRDGDVTAQDTVPVDAAFVDALLAGDIYLNIHTALNPTGEVRGQVLVEQ